MKQELCDADRCLLRDSALLAVTHPEAAGFLDKRANISGWYQYWFSLSGSQLLYFERAQSGRRGCLVGTVSLFRHNLIVLNTAKRPREFEITDHAGRLHVLRAGSETEMHWWIQAFSVARNKIPPAQPFGAASGALIVGKGAPVKPAKDEMPSTIIDNHLRVDHVLCVVHGIGVDSDALAENVRLMQENYTEIMEKIFPDVDFRVELLVVQWRDALMNLDVHRKLQSVTPKNPVTGEANPLREFMASRMVDYGTLTSANN